MDCVVLFAKSPRPGRVKTRLCPPLTHGQAARLYRAMAVDCWRAARAAAPEAWVALDCGAGRLEAAWLGSGVKAFRQKGADLGARMSAAFARAFRAGAAKTVVIGSDCPELSSMEIRSAFEKLDRADVVVGPAADGGYYLLALKGACPPLFEGMVWSRPDVLARTLRRATALGMRTAFLRRRSDVDTFADLKALARRHPPLQTAAALSRILA